MYKDKRAKFVGESIKRAGEWLRTHPEPSNTVDNLRSKEVPTVYFIKIPKPWTGAIIVTRVGLTRTCERVVVPNGIAYFNLKKLYRTYSKKGWKMHEDPYRVLFFREGRSDLTGCNPSVG